MIPILSAVQIRQADSFTISHEHIESVDLMERAAWAFLRRFLALYPGGNKIAIFCGTGNNGGDGLAIARLLLEANQSISVFCIGDLAKSSIDFQINHDRLQGFIPIWWIEREEGLAAIEKYDVIIDGLFGSGLTREITGFYAKVIQWINNSKTPVVAIDMPSGLFADSHSDEKSTIVKASHTITFQIPKLSLFLPSYNQFVGQLFIENIGLNEAFIKRAETSFYLTETKDLFVPTRNKYAHKGEAGRVLIVAGSKGKMGAAILCSQAAVRAGAGLLFVHTPACGLNILQVAVPEAMVIVDEHDEVITEVLPDKGISAVAIGPGIGTGRLSVKALEHLLTNCQSPLILDADALNILSENRELINLLPAESILTPHPGEFKRLVGDWKDDFHKLDLLREFCKTYRLNVLLKGANSAVCNSHGQVYFNPTGNPGMATGGSGDVLTGIIAAFLGQGLPPFEALKSGVFIHGVAGDFAKQKVGEISLIASDLIEFLPKAILSMGHQLQDFNKFC